MRGNRTRPLLASSLTRLLFFFLSRITFLQLHCKFGLCLPYDAYVLEHVHH